MVGYTGEAREKKELVENAKGQKKYLKIQELQQIN